MLIGIYLNFLITSKVFPVFLLSNVEGGEETNDSLCYDEAGVEIECWKQAAAGGSGA